MSNTKTSQSPVRELPPLELAKKAGGCTPDLTTVCDWDRYVAGPGLGRMEAQAASHMFGTARAFLVRARWCDEILEEYVGLVHPGTIGVFLFRVRTRRLEIGDWGWVIAGNLPTGFVATQKAWSAPRALEIYADGLCRWAEAQQVQLAREKPSSERTSLLKTLDRLKITLGWVQNEILPAYAGDLALLR